MSRSEFRWNKKRKHYAYLFKDIGRKRLNLLISSKPVMVGKKNKKKKRFYKNVPLFHHPNRNKIGQFYVVRVIYLDDLHSFDDKSYAWSWDRNDKRKIKRLKKGHRTC